LTDDNGSVNPYTGKDGKSGDPAGYGQAAYPADSPNVIAFGGTSLTVVGNGDYTYSSESVWNNGLNNGFYEATGGGISNFESQPTYQASAASSFSTTARTAPDVSFLADPNTGVVVLDSYEGSYFQDGGTSLSSPCWAGLIAIADQIRASAGESSLGGPTQALPILYDLYGSASYGTDFHDVTSGDNGTYPAATGYDLATGIGMTPSWPRRSNSAKTS
jgi:subtilase family serine protease